jgi:hypothetical protein
MEVLDLFAYLIKLKQLEFIEIRFIPEALQKDFVNFIAGNTLTRITDDRKPLIPRNLYNLWIAKLNTTGFDYSFDCKTVSLPEIPNLFS